MLSLNFTKNFIFFTLFFIYLIIKISIRQSNMQQPNNQIELPQNIIKNLIDKSDQKKQLAYKQLEIIIKKNVAKKNYMQIEKIINYFRDRYIKTSDLNKKRSGLEAQPYIINGIKNSSQAIDKLAPLVIDIILESLNDPEHKVRYTALKSLYYICQALDDKILKMFNKIFENIIGKITDLDQQTRNAARFLDSALQTTLNSALINSTEDFDLKTFMGILKSKFKSINPAIRQFLIVWINVLNQNVSIDLLQYLPDLLQDLLFMLGDKQKNLRSSAQQCLKNFQKQMNQKFYEGKLELIINEQTINQILSILIRVAKGKSSVYSKLLTIVWFKTIFSFFKSQLDIKVKIPNNKYYFKKIIIDRFDQVLQPILLMMSHDQQQVKKASFSANQLLMNVIQMVKRQQTINFSKVMPLLKGMLSQKKSTPTSESALRWMKFMLENYNDKILPQINDIIQKLVEKLCDSSGKSVISIIQNTTVTQQYFERLIQKMLILLLNKSQTDQKPQQILKRFSSILQPDKFCKTLAVQMIQTFQDHNFIFQIVHYLNLLIITQKNMLKVRKILQTRSDPDFFHSLFSAFIYNPSSAVSLCLLSQEYELAYLLIMQIGRTIQITNSMLHGFIKMASMIESPGFLYLRIQMLNRKGHPFLIESLCALLMILPQGKISYMLKNRIEISKLASSSQQKSIFKSVQHELQQKLNGNSSQKHEQNFLKTQEKQKYLKQYLRIQNSFNSK